MGPVSAEVTIDAPRERVFALLCDLAARPTFTDHFIGEYRIERLPPEGVGAGARFRTGPASNRIWMETVIADAEPPMRIVERGRGGRVDRIPIFTSWELVAGSGSNTLVRVSFWTEPSHALDRMRERLGSRHWYRRRWRRALRRLKQAAEGTRPIETVRVAGGDRVPIT
jgi:uncharacterized protein YndB with AHSA1/START domain